ncbi:Sjoegren syndrome/scleroderma autoantigen 1 [Phytophthora citrophthora]|uniref:Sjoegren syndrome/scleroderma autoantigen 1 n=1 Tax=Phytophthora citrophthora TaxID=4793 RepID=A0AAD9GV75_9STRA|nr:Sjoegren syndrome/scleroderma autoantigen 1 [Phytophthora citrophthora]
MAAQAMTPVKRSRDEASKLLGEKMLQGWTMLGASCPVEDCYTPLMRNKQGKMFCVRCDQFVVSEEEAKKQQEEQEAEELALAEKEAMEAEAQAEAERRRRIEQQFRFEEQAKQAREMQELEQAKAARTTAAPGSAKRKIDNTMDTSRMDSDAELNAIRRQTLAALYQKMGALTDSLSPTDHSERLISVAKAVREFAEAAQLLKQ